MCGADMLDPVQNSDIDAPAFGFPRADPSFEHLSTTTISRSTDKDHVLMNP